MEMIEKRFVVDLIIKIANGLLANEEQIPSYLLFGLAMALETGRNRTLWEKLRDLSSEARLRMIGQAIYPSVWFRSPAAIFKNV